MPPSRRLLKITFLDQAAYGEPPKVHSVNWFGRSACGLCGNVTLGLDLWKPVRPVWSSPVSEGFRFRWNHLLKAITRTFIQDTGDDAGDLWGYVARNDWWVYLADSHVTLFDLPRKCSFKVCAKSIVRPLGCHPVWQFKVSDKPRNINIKVGLKTNYFLKREIIWKSARTRNL